jgi:flagellar assembly factor FliW
MPHVQTRDFGLLECDPHAALQFPRGLPGFEDQDRFVLIEQEALAPVVYLQSLKTPALCFLTVPISAIDPHYEMGMTAEDLALLALDETGQPSPGANILCLSILSAAANGRFTANLLAPVVVNLETRIGLQAVRTDVRYSHLHPLYEETPC